MTHKGASARTTSRGQRRTVQLSRDGRGRPGGRGLCPDRALTGRDCDTHREYNEYLCHLAGSGPLSGSASRSGALASTEARVNP